MTVLQEIEDFLPCHTPQLWIENALANPELLLIDHANCEKKAASTIHVTCARACRGRTRREHHTSNKNLQDHFFLILKFLIGF